MNFPTRPLELIRLDGKLYVKDIIRNKNVRLTPEEWVRQHLINYLVHDLGYPKGLIKVETNVKFNALEQRSDVVVYNKDGEVFLLVECKRPEVKIDSNALFQAVRYNTQYSAEFILITNGNEHHCFRVKSEQGGVEVMDAFPVFE